MLERDGRTPQPVRIAGRAEAEQLVAGVLATMGDLEALLEAETGHVRVGRFREGLSQEARKAELSAAYLQGLEAVKANAIALARFAPAALASLKDATADSGAASRRTRWSWQRPAPSPRPSSRVSPTR